jgi:hypothetical protein
MRLLLSLACLGQDVASTDRLADCGTSAVYCFCRFQKAETGFHEVRQALEQFGRPPYSMLDLQQALAGLGRPVEAARLQEVELPDRTPFIAFLKTPGGGHFMTCRIDRRAGRAEFVDSRDSWEGAPHQLVQIPGWTGIVLVPRREFRLEYAVLGASVLAGSIWAVRRRRGDAIDETAPNTGQPAPVGG